MEGASEMGAPEESPTPDMSLESFLGQAVAGPSEVNEEFGVGSIPHAASAPPVSGSSSFNWRAGFNSEKARGLMQGALTVAGSKMDRVRMKGSDLKEQVLETKNSVVSKGGLMKDAAVNAAGAQMDKVRTMGTDMTGQVLGKKSSPQVAATISEGAGAEEDAQVPNLPALGPSSGAIQQKGKDGTSLQNLYRGFTKEAVNVAGPTVRESLHQVRMMSCDVKEKVLEKKSTMVSKVVSALDIPDPAQGTEVPAARPKEEFKRRWNVARDAAHRPHTPEDDPPAPPERARWPVSSAPSSSSSAAAAPAAAAAAEELPSTTARGVLEVEVMAFGAGLRCADGAAALTPVCQFLFGERCTGALRPRAAIGRGARHGSATGPPGAAGAGGGAGDAEGAATRSSLPCSARFAVNEVSGSDLRLHVFDVDSSKFGMGFEDRAFCGGALVPLSVLHHRGGGCMNGLMEQSPMVEIGVRLLPLELLRERSKLGTLKDAPKSLREGSLELGHVLLRLKLHLYDHTVPGMLFLDPFLGVPPATPLEVARIDDPMSVATAVGDAMQRMRNAIDVAPCGRAVDELRESPAHCMVLLTVWTYSMLVASPWRQPGCILFTVLMLMWQVSVSSRKTRGVNPPRFFVEDGCVESPEREKLSLRERAGEGLRKAANIQLNMMKFARTLNAIATQLEKLRFILSLRDPYVSMIFGALLLGFCWVASILLWVLSLVPGRLGVPLVIWAAGVVALLPRELRSRLREDWKWLRSEKERRFGPDRVGPALQSLWKRVPDGVETQHWDLFEGRVLLPQLAS